jgi:glucose-6-phosphate isomerase
MIDFSWHEPDFLATEPDREETLRRAETAHETLLNGTGAGSEMTGWRQLVLAPDDALLSDLAEKAQEIRSKADVFLCIGIGGSYLGAKAVIDALNPSFGRGHPEVLFAGYHMGTPYMVELLDYLEGKSVYVNVISKSGTTLEPALAFRFIRDWMAPRFGDLERRIIVTTDAERGALNDLQSELGLKKYVIPDNVGGRFSVLTPVGLLPIAVSGVDIRSLLYGAVPTARRLVDKEDNPSLAYAAYRYLLHERDYAVEALATFDPRLAGIGGWWQQLFGESEGKDGKGLLPITLRYTTDLHSLGQYVQEGRRTVAETFLLSAEPPSLNVPSTDTDLDGLAYLAGRPLADINAVAYEGTLKAHLDGNVPCASIEIGQVTPDTIGSLLYFFEHTVAVSAYMLGLNPFDQPGVEAYKKEMFKRLGKS